jgi:hypothetical protein
MYRGQIVGGVWNHALSAGSLLRLGREANAALISANGAQTR